MNHPMNGNSITQRVMAQPSSMEDRQPPARHDARDKERPAVRLVPELRMEDSKGDIHARGRAGLDRQ